MPSKPDSSERPPGNRRIRIHGSRLRRNGKARPRHGLSFEARLRVLCAEAPAILGLVTGEARAPVTSQILEKSVACRRRRAVRLERGDRATRIAVDL